MSRRPTITAAIIALDEMRNLGELLPQLDWVDEIVVVDGGSTDGTVAAARSHGCRVLCRRFDSFARQRNHALQAATGEWVLSIDADERPTPQLAAEIRRRIASAREAGFRIPIRSSIFGRPFRASGTQDDRPIRLVRSRMARWVGDVHERLLVSGRVGGLRGWLRHETTPDLHTFLAKMHRYTMLEARSRVRAGRPPRGGDAWLAPVREVFRRLIWKRGYVDGPEGWAFCLLSGLSEWVLADRHRRFWQAAQRASSPTAGSPSRPDSLLAPIPSESANAGPRASTGVEIDAENAVVCQLVNCESGATGGLSARAESRRIHGQASCPCHPQQ